jgi:hypothetical protein
MKKFEYTIVSIKLKSANTEKELNELGEQGWELVAADGAYLYLKREKV